MDKDYLTLKRASASRPSGEWHDDDFDVLADGVVVGRIMRRLRRRWDWPQRGVAFLMRKRPPAASVLNFPVLSPCLFSSLLDCQPKNVCGHRETRRTSLTR
jgi:hypothetical protein